MGNGGGGGLGEAGGLVENRTAPVARAVWAMMDGFGEGEASGPRALRAISNAGGAGDGCEQEYCLVSPS